MVKINEVDKMKNEKVRNELRARGYEPYDVLREKLKEIFRYENEKESLLKDKAPQEEQLTTHMELEQHSQEVVEQHSQEVVEQHSQEVVEQHSQEVVEHSQEDVAQDVSNAEVAPDTSSKRKTPQETALPLMKMKDAYKKNPEENSYEVEQVLDMRFKGKKHKFKEYLIRWKGYSSDHDSWIKEAGLDLSIEKYDLSEELKKKLNT